MPSLSWNEEADVVVVGYGGAGAVSAISAHDAGARVLLLEKQPQDTRTTTHHSPSSRMAGGGWFCPPDVESAVTYMEAMVRAANETLDQERRELIHSFARGAVETAAWMRRMGAEASSAQDVSSTLRQIASETPQIRLEEERVLFPEFPELPGSDCAYVYHPKAVGPFRNGAAFFKVLSNNVQQRGIPVLWGAPAAELVVRNGQVQGVVARRGRKRIAVRARRGVILTCGGFEYNEWMKENYLRTHPSHFYGNPGNTGEGITMALQAGAALWHMNCASWRVTMKFPEFPVAFSLATRLDRGGFFVDKGGKRFSNERFKLHAFGYEVGFFDSQLPGFPRIPCYWIFDEKRKQAGMIASSHGPCNPPGGVPGPNYYVWSDSNEAEIERGWIFHSSTIRGLAEQLAAQPDNGGMMSPSALEESLRQYNAVCRQGEDTQFRRPQRSLVPLEDPPFYAVKLWPGGPNTQGGPRRNVRGQVMGLSGKPVPHLYSAGELGSVWGMLYQGGGNLTECIVFGCIAGENAAQEKPVA